MAIPSAFPTSYLPGRDGMPPAVPARLPPNPPEEPAMRTMLHRAAPQADARARISDCHVHSASPGVSLPARP